MQAKDIYSYGNLCDHLRELQARYPAVEVLSIGRSVEGRNLFAVRIGFGPRSIHYTGGMHANEWITAPLLVQFCFDYCRTLEEMGKPGGIETASTYQRSTVWITPLVNPDGATLVQQGIQPENPLFKQVMAINGGSTNFSEWKSNINGVDLNHQFPAGWPIQAAKSLRIPSPRDYAGSYSLSEPESQALANFTTEQNFDAVLAFHTQGQVIYWGYRGMEPAESQKLAAQMGSQTGYSVIRYAGTHAGYKDWFIEHWRRPGFTVEVGLGINPLPMADLPKIYSRLAKMLAWCPNTI